MTILFHNQNLKLYPFYPSIQMNKCLNFNYTTSLTSDI